jgi:hypothetical protein
LQHLHLLFAAVDQTEQNSSFLLPLLRMAGTWLPSLWRCICTQWWAPSASSIVTQRGKLKWPAPGLQLQLVRGHSLPTRAIAATSSPFELCALLVMPIRVFLSAAFCLNEEMCVSRAMMASLKSFVPSGQPRRRKSWRFFCNFRRPRMQVLNSTPFAKASASSSSNSASSPTSALSAIRSSVTKLQTALNKSLEYTKQVSSQLSIRP